MKLALVRARYSPYGGAERFAARAMQALAERGAEVTIVARSWPVGAEEALEKQLSKLHAHFLRCDPFYLGSLWRDASFARGVRKLVAQQSFDLVQSHERIAGLDGACSIYRAGDGVHAAWLERRGAVQSALKRWSVALNPHHRYLLSAERRMYEDPALRAVICNSRMVRDEILERFAIAPEKLHVVANGVDLDRFHPSIAGRFRAAMRVELGIDEAAPCLLLVGSGFERKGVATALQALALAKRAGPVALVVVGGDKHAARYEELAGQLGVAPMVRFVGEKADTLAYYGMADAFMLPSVYDPFPNAALEALACGLPVIASDACGVKEVLAQGVSGWVCPVDDERCLAAAIGEVRQLLMNTSATVALRSAARAAAEPYSLAALGASLASLYETLLANR